MGIAEELEALRDRKLVTKRLRDTVEAPRPAAVVNVGVTFRTDGRGRVHGDHDCKAFECVNDMLKERFQHPPFNVVPVSLPRGSGFREDISTTPDRVAESSDLDGIDLLFIPGAPTAVDSQESSTDPIQNPRVASEERDFQRATDPGNDRPTGKKSGKRYDRKKRVFEEHRSRAPYEIRLMEIARTRGIPILAVCAGSWRLLECYGGKVRTLDVGVRGRHRNPANIWGIAHEVRTTRPHDSILGALAERSPVLPATNTTHWAVASTTRTKGTKLATRTGSSEKPHRQLMVTARDPVTKTVEAFETKYGAPVLGIQWHPESYLPGMPGAEQGSREVQRTSIRIFEFVVYAAYASRVRRGSLVASLNQEVRAFDHLCECARHLASRQFREARVACERAVGLMTRDLWSGRMLHVEQAIRTLILIWTKFRDQPVGAGNLYRDAASVLREYGVNI